MSPEARARQKIDALLIAAGWAIQDYKQLNLGAASGIAVREVPLKSGPCDYLLLVDRVPVGVIEAKKAGTTLSGVVEQSANYAESLPDFLADLLPGTKGLPFTYESTVLEPFAESVRQRFDAWLTKRQGRRGVPPLATNMSRDSSSTFLAEQLAWLALIRDQVATTCSIEPNDFEFALSRSGAGWVARINSWASRSRRCSTPVIAKLNRATRLRPSILRSPFLAEAQNDNV